MILRRVKDYQSKALKDTPFREDRSPIDSDYLREDQEVTWSHVPSLSEDLSDSRHRLKLAHENRIQRTQWLEKFRVEKQYQNLLQKKSNELLEKLPRALSSHVFKSGLDAFKVPSSSARIYVLDAGIIRWNSMSCMSHRRQTMSIMGPSSFQIY